MLVEDDGLWIGDDTEFLNDEFHPRLKFLPETTVSVDRPAPAALPTTVFTAESNSLDAVSFDGSTLGAPIELAAGSPWGDVRGMVALSGALFYGRNDASFWVRSFDGTTVGPPTRVALNGLTTDEFPVAAISGMYFDHERGRLYYTLIGADQLYYRHFTPEHPILGARQFEEPTSAGIPWGLVRGMERIDDHLYFGLPGGTLHRMDMDGTSPIIGTDILLSGPNVDGRDWSTRAMSFFSEGDLFGPPPSDAEYEFDGTGDSATDSWHVFRFPVAPGDDLAIKLEWADPTAGLNVFLRDERGTTIEADRLGSGSPKWLTTTAASGGEWSVAVSIQQGSTDFRALVNPFEEPPASRAEFEFNATGSATVGSWQVFDIDVSAGDPIAVQLEWADPNAELNVFLRDGRGNTAVGDSSLSGSPKAIEATATSTGTWSVGVKIKSGATAYAVLVNPT